MEEPVTLLMIGEGDDVNNRFKNKMSHKEAITKTVLAVTNMACSTRHPTNGAFITTQSFAKQTCKTQVPSPSGTLSC
jgi:hypothetical protein